MDDPVITALRQRLAPFERTAWTPELADGPAPPGGSQLGGPGALRAGEPAPACGHCGRPMPLFVQLAGAELPAPYAERLRGGVLQLFYCTNADPPCESVCQAFFPHARSTLLRLVPTAELGADAPDPTHATPTPELPARRVVGWTPAPDLPGWEELQELGVALDDEEADALADGDLPLGGDKLGGWPLWVQSVEYPACRRCGRRMELLFQVDSEQGVAWQFGDAGVGHVTQCPEHRDELAFGWACS